MLKVLRNIVQEVSNAGTLDDALNTIVKRAKQALEADASAIFFLENDTNEFVLRATQGLNQALVNQLRLPLHQGLIGLVAERKEAINLADVTQHEAYHLVSQSGEERYHGFLGVPIQHRRRLLGVIIVEQEEARPFEAAEEAFLVTLSAQLATVIAEAEIKGLGIRKTDEQLLPEMLQGIPSSNGVGIGQVVVVYPPADLDAVPDQVIAPEHINAEQQYFLDALETTKNEMHLLGERLSSSLPQEEQALFSAYASMLESDSIKSEVLNHIQQGYSSQSSLKFTIKSHMRQFKAMENEYLQERAMDIEDLGRRILANLQNDEDEDIVYPDNTVLVGNQISAAHLAAVPEGQLSGVVCGTGSSNSHIAILARALGVSCVMGVGEMVLKRLDKLKAIVDGYQGQVYLRPNLHVLHEFENLAAEEEALESDLDVLRDLPAETSDGHRVNLFVNMGLLADVGQSMTTGAEGVGLYRTEVPFMTRDRFPSSEEQRIIYRQLLNVFSPRPVTMRILDIGGDKPLPYFSVDEENPFLGWRGIRVLLEHPEIFLTQVKAMLRASEGLHNLRIMLPLITDIAEVTESLEMIEFAYQEIKQEKRNVVRPEIGIMVEVPSAVYQAKELASQVDFLSVGSNDLIQYLLAVDRNNTHVADLYSAYHPAVLKALRQVASGAHDEGRLVSICGEMASDPGAVILLLAMGFDSFSVSAPLLPRVKWVIRRFSRIKARKLLTETLQMGSAYEIKSHLDRALEEQGLGGLIRAGRY